MQRLRLALMPTLALITTATATFASPTMIRLGYSDCAACHLSPQGGGLLTTYGKGVDTAQSLRVHEVQPIDTEQRRSLFDVRVVFASQLVDAAATPAVSGLSTFRAFARGALKVSERSRIHYATALESRRLTTAQPAVRLGTTANLVVTKALWDYRPAKGLVLAIGRDEMPDGIGLPEPQSFIRTASDPGDTVYPTQVKAFVSYKRLQLTPYVFGPGGDEPAAVRQHGAGSIVGVDIWRQHAVVGVSARLSRGTTIDRDTMAGFARLGFNRWGILAEHDVTERRTRGAANVATGYLAGHTQVFVALREWLVSSIALEHVATAVVNKDVGRITAGLQARLSDRLTVLVNARDVFTGATAVRQRSVTVQLAVKTIQ